jgi:hypothetical protein
MANDRQKKRRKEHGKQCHMSNKQKQNRRKECG